MPEPQIVPPTPTVTQPANEPGIVAPPAGVDNSPGIDRIQSLFDAVLPPSPAEKEAAKPPAPHAPPTTQPRRETEPPPPVTEPQKPPTEKPAAPVEHKIPSFLEEALRTEKPPAAARAEEIETEWADDLPPEQKQSRIKGLRDAYKRVKDELATVRNRQPDQPNLERMNFLEAQNKQMSEVLSRVGVEHSPDFQQSIMQPLYANWHEATRIVKEAGGNPEDLRAAMSMSGRAQFEALDNLFADIPESAKAEAHDALRNYRRYDEARRAAIADAPRTLETLKQRENQRQYQELGKARNDMKDMFDRALSTLRDEAKVEVFLKTNDPETKWWNEQGDNVIDQARSLFLENTDLNKVAYACLLAPAADAYRNLFMKAQKQVAELKQVIKEKGWQEPTLSESSGNASHLTSESQLQADLKRPFNEVFLREFHRNQQRGR